MPNIFDAFEFKIALQFVFLPAVQICCKAGLCWSTSYHRSKQPTNVPARVSSVKKMGATEDGPLLKKHAANKKRHKAGITVSTRPVVRFCLFSSRLFFK